MEQIFLSFVVAILIFMPAYFGNMMPLLVKNMRAVKGVKWWTIDGGLKLGKYRLFGETKTWMGLVAGAVGGGIGGIFQFSISFPFGPDVYSNDLSLWTLIWMGSFVGLCALLGDLIKSFFKRRLGYESGQPWLFFDQIDFIVGAYVGLLLLGLVDGLLLHSSLFYVLVITPALHVAANVIAWKTGMKKEWW